MCVHACMCMTPSWTPCQVGPPGPPPAPSQVRGSSRQGCRLRSLQTGRWSKAALQSRAQCPKPPLLPMYWAPSLSHTTTRNSKPIPQCSLPWPSTYIHTCIRQSQSGWLRQVCPPLDPCGPLRTCRLVCRMTPRRSRWHTYRPRIHTARRGTSGMRKYVTHTPQRLTHESQSARRPHNVRALPAPAGAPGRSAGKPDIHQYRYKSPRRTQSPRGTAMAYAEVCAGPAQTREGAPPVTCMLCRTKLRYILL